MGVFALPAFLLNMLIVVLSEPALARYPAWIFNENKKHLKNVGPIRHCELPHAHSPGVTTVALEHRCPRRRRQRQRVTGDRYGPIEWAQLQCC